MIDTGVNYRVRIGDSVREFSDGAHSCDERAYAAALFVLLTLDPPTVAPPELAAPPPAVVRRAAPPPRPRFVPAIPEVLIEVAGTFDNSTQRDPMRSGGAIGELSLTWQQFGFTFGAEALTPTVYKSPIENVRLTRVPIFLAARAGLRRNRFDLGLDLGAALTLMLAEGLGTEEPSSGHRIDVSAYGALHWRCWLYDRIAVVASVRTILSPRPYDLIVEPVGRIGRLRPLAQSTSAARAQ